MFVGLIKRGLNKVHARAKDYTLHKALEAKGIASNKAQKNSEYLMEKGKEKG